MKEHFAVSLVGISIIFGSFSKVDTAGFYGWGEDETYPEMNERLFEGDIELDRSQRQELNSDWQFGIGGGSNKREHYLWNHGIVPYDIDSDFGKEEIRLVKTAMRRISRSTCIKFVERTTEKDYIYFRHGDGCSSFVGRQGRKQDIILKAKTCFREGTIMHQIMHALGFWHEQSRFDREKFIQVQYKNIERGHEHDFDRHIGDVDTQGLPYDYDSIMHYGGNVFAFDPRKKTIVPTGRLPRGLKIGQRDDLSTLDILRINKLYHCQQYYPLIPAPAQPRQKVLISAKPDYIVHPVGVPPYDIH